MPHDYELEFVTSEDHPKRAVAFLVSSDSTITAKSAFDQLDRNSELLLRTRFESWRDRIVNKKWYHGWDQSEFKGKYTDCFVFKCKGRRKGNKSDHRFYGFLCNPKLSASEKGYQVCILVIYALKEEWDTDISNLRVVEEIKSVSAIQKAIADYFKEIS